MLDVVQLIEMCFCCASPYHASVLENRAHIAKICSQNWFGFQRSAGTASLKGSDHNPQCPVCFRYGMVDVVSEGEFGVQPYSKVTDQETRSKVEPLIEYLDEIGDRFRVTVNDLHLAGLRFSFQSADH